MKLQRSTGVLLGVAIALVTTVAIIETTKNSQTNDDQTLYDFTEGDINAFTINHENTTLSFSKTSDGAWQMNEPQDVEADPSSIDFLLNIITSDTIKETINTDSEQLADYGLADPTARIELTVDEEQYTLAVGDEDFSGTSLYVTKAANDTSSEAIEVYLMPNGLENAIERPLDDWIINEQDDTATDDLNDTAPKRQLNDADETDAELTDTEKQEQ